MNSLNNLSNKNYHIFNQCKPKGLANIHGSCYLNSILQCLFHLRPLSLFFLEKQSKFYNNSLCKSYFLLVSGLLNKNGTYFSPNAFIYALCNLNSNFNSFGNDPKDVLLDFLFYINKELLGDEQSFVLKNEIKKTEKFELFQYYKDEFKRSQTIITELFGWFKQIEKTCSICNKKTYEFIIDTNFIFNLKKICKDMKRNYLSLKECFNYYFSDETKKFTCKNEKCRTTINGGKISNKICVLPNYLIIILDRGKDDEINCNIDFDYDLDLDDVTEEIEYKSNTKYKLLGATFLYGTSGAGHTIAFCKHFDGKYYIFDDTKYYERKLENLKKDKPFIIFYEKEL